jgi:hypothetical protein
MGIMGTSEGTFDKIYGTNIITHEKTSWELENARN